MIPAQFAVWEWVDDKGTPVYVGRGKYVGEKHPARLMFESRTDPKKDSHLMRWLCSLDAEPKRSESVPALKLHHAEAASWFYIRRQQCKERGLSLLSTRPFGTTTGGGASRAVVSPEGDVYISVRAASRETGISTAEIVRLCNLPKSLWRYIDANSNQS